MALKQQDTTGGPGGIGGQYGGVDAPLRRRRAGLVPLQHYSQFRRQQSVGYRFGVIPHAPV